MYLSCVQYISVFPAPTNPEMEEAQPTLHALPIEIVEALQSMHTA
jgi:hypothetical protein